MKRLMIGFLLVAAGACSGQAIDDVAPPLDAKGPADLSAAAGDLASTDASGDLSVVLDLAAKGPDMSAYVCYGDGGSFPAYDKACTNSMSCSIGFHQTDCCGSERALGFNHAYRNAFDMSEASFRISCPAACNCAARPTLCDDGKTGTKQSITVSCDNGRCITHGV